MGVMVDPRVAVLNVVALAMRPPPPADFNAWAEALSVASPRRQTHVCNSGPGIRSSQVFQASKNGLSWQDFGPSPPAYIWRLKGTRLADGCPALAARLSGNESLGSCLMKLMSFMIYAIWPVFGTRFVGCYAQRRMSARRNACAVIG